MPRRRRRSAEADRAPLRKREEGAARARIA